MDWFASGSCSAAGQFGWLVGVASGVWAGIVVMILILTTPAYHRDVPRAVGVGLRINSQRLLKLAPFLLIALWVAGARHVGGADLSCYAAFLSFGMLAVVAPIMLLLMFTAANIVGCGSAR